MKSPFYTKARARIVLKYYPVKESKGLFNRTDPLISCGWGFSRMVPKKD